MVPWLILLAGICAALCLLLWFRDVRRVMRERRNTVESAAGQLAAWREKARDAPDAAAMIERSEAIYSQAVDIYNRTLRMPWNYLPARLLGFHPI